MKINPFCGIQRTQDLSSNDFRQKPASPGQCIVEFPFPWVITDAVTGVDTFYSWRYVVWKGHPEVYIVIL